jgi:hypothetical protein
MMLHHLTSGFENVAHFSLIPPTKNEENILRVDGWDDAYEYISTGKSTTIGKLHSFITKLSANRHVQIQEGK